MRVKKKSIENALNKIEVAYKMGNIPIYDQILKNYAKGYKPAKDFVKNLARMIEEGEFKTNIDILNYLSNLEPREIVPHSYSKYPKSN
jgi:predicted nucleotidyltransferase